MTARCTGHCCVAFPLKISPAELRKRVEEARAEDLETERTGMLPPIARVVCRIEDGEKLLDMLIYLGERATWPDGRPYADDTQLHHTYTCRHYDAASGDCQNYANRPRMCSEYPYGRACDIPSCTAPDRGIHFVPARRLTLKDIV